MQERLKLDALEPQARELYLPYSKRIIKVILFDANAVFISFLTYSKLNIDKNYFHDPDDPGKDPFARPSDSIVGDIITGYCYTRTYD